MNEDGTMARVPELAEIAESHQLKMITIKDLIEYRYNITTLVNREVDITRLTSARLEFTDIQTRLTEKNISPLSWGCPV